MEVNRTTFGPSLLSILEAISASHFIALDFEFSGVANQIKRAGGTVRQTLQQRYDETRRAAQKYQVLQVGITCVEKNQGDHQNKKQAVRKDDGNRYSALSAEPAQSTPKGGQGETSYVLRTYNATLSPLLDEQLEVERDVTFQSGAVGFLMRNGFDMDAPFSTGVPYLSRNEEAEALLMAKRRMDKSRFEDIVLTDKDVEALAFMKKVREEIEEWVSTTGSYRTGANLMISSRQSSLTSKVGFVSGSGSPSSSTSYENDLAGFDRRLVHQLVRAEYPELATSTKGGSVLIERLDKAKERYNNDRRAQRSNDQINAHIGFRWVIEAMCGGDIHEINLKRLVSSREFDFYESTRRHSAIKRALSARRAVLVGHNVFNDLIYFYQCFIGDLPESLGEFRQWVNEAFPLVVDTKYMATHNCGSINPASSLEQIDEGLAKQKFPQIHTPVEFDKYTNQESLHEAGFDSYLTARVMVRLSAKLAGGKMPEFEDVFWKEYGNRLRVFGTVETYMELDSVRELESTVERALVVGV